MKCTREYNGVRCGGDILMEMELAYIGYRPRYFCSLCSREFDENGRELVPVMVTARPSYDWMKAVPRPEKYRSKVMHRNNW